MQQLKPDIQKSEQLQFALKVYSAVDKNNYVLFFKLVRSTTYLNACILLRYFTQVRIKALRTILKCYAPRATSTKFSVVELMNMLAFEDASATADFFEYYGLQLEDNGETVSFAQRCFVLPELTYFQERAVNLIESKRTCLVGDMVVGSAESKGDFENHTQQDSFDENGQLIIPESLQELLKQQAPAKTERESPFTDSSEKKTSENKALFAFAKPEQSTSPFGIFPGSGFSAKSQQSFFGAPTAKPSGNLFGNYDTTDTIHKPKPIMSSTKSIFATSAQTSSLFGNVQFQSTQQPLFALPNENMERERAEREKAERERVEQERIERARVERERLRERIERERIEQEIIERERIEQLRVAKQRQVEEDRLQQRLLEQQRKLELEREQERVRIELEEKKRKQLEEEERLRRELEEKKRRLEKQKQMEQERLEREKKRKKEEELRIAINQVCNYLVNPRLATVILSIQFFL